MVQTRSQDSSTSTRKRASPSPSTEPPAKKQKKTTPTAQVKKEGTKSPAPSKPHRSTKKPSISSPANGSTNKSSSSSPPTKTEHSPTPSNNNSNNKDDDDDDDDPVLINRAPVLHLWTAVLTHHLHPSLSWHTCLSAGHAVSAICAIAKGRAIGTVEPKDSSKATQQPGEDEKEEVLEIMHFKLRMDGGEIYVGETAQSGDEDGLRKKFGERYEDVKACFERALKERGEDGLNEKGFKMYEKFRPDVKRGQKGWGRKGELNLEEVRSVICET